MLRHCDKVLFPLYYFDVLLSKEFFLPPTARETVARSNRQAETSAERRTREQEDAFAIQHAAAPEEIPEEELIPVDEEGTDDPAAEPTLTSTDLELLRTLRLLSRINDRQNVLQYGATTQGDALHAGAPPLAPTGAGAWLAATTMIGAVGWTLRRAREAERGSWLA